MLCGVGYCLELVFGGYLLFVIRSSVRYTSSPSHAQKEIKNRKEKKENYSTPDQTFGLSRHSPFLECEGEQRTNKTKGEEKKPNRTKRWHPLYCFSLQRSQCEGCCVFCLERMFFFCFCFFVLSSFFVCGATGKICGAETTFWFLFPAD